MCARTTTVTKPGIESSRRAEAPATDISKAIVGRNECTRMPPDSAAAAARGRREINKEGNAANAQRSDARLQERSQIRLPFHPTPTYSGHVIWVAGGGAVGACNKMSVRECACAFARVCLRVSCYWWILPYIFSVSLFRASGCNVPCRLQAALA